MESYLVVETQASLEGKIIDYKGAPVRYDHYEHLPKPEPEVVQENGEVTG